MSTETVNAEPEEPTPDDLPIEAETPDQEPLARPMGVRSKTKTGSSKPRVSPRPSTRTPVEPKPRVPNRVTSVWQFAYHRLQLLRSSGAIRREALLTALLLILIFALPYASWLRRWTLPDSLQSFGTVVLPLALAWAWLNRYRLMLPELDTLMKRYQAGRIDRLTPGEKWAREEREYNAVLSLLKEKPLPAKRLFFPLFLASVFTCIAMWINDPTVTGLAFVFLVISLVGYRHGTQTLRVAVFPLLFLFLMVPIPGEWLETARV